MKKCLLTAALILGIGIAAAAPAEIPWFDKALVGMETGPTAGWIRSRMAELEAVSQSRMIPLSILRSARSPRPPNLVIARQLHPSTKTKP